MRINLDQYGRVQLPSDIMERLKLVPGSALDCSMLYGGIFMLPLKQNGIAPFPGKPIPPPAKIVEICRKCIALAA